MNGMIHWSLYLICQTKGDTEKFKFENNMVRILILKRKKEGEKEHVK